MTFPRNRAARRCSVSSSSGPDSRGRSPSPIYDRFGRFVARVDLAWPDLRVALEYDGAYHNDPAQIVLDRKRLNAIQACNWSTLVIDRAQFRDESQVIDLVRAVRAAQSRR